MSAFRYEAIETSGAPVQGVIEAEDRKAALQLLGRRGLFPSTLEVSASNGSASAPAAAVDRSRSQAQPFGRAHPAEGNYGVHSRDERAAQRGHSHPASLERFGRARGESSLAGSGAEDCGRGAERGFVFRRPGRASQTVQQALRQHGARGGRGRRAPAGHGGPGELART